MVVLDANAEAVLRYQSFEEQVTALSARVEALRAENQGLKKASIKTEKETHEFVSYFQREVEKKDELIARLNEKLAVTQQTLTQEREQGKLAYESKINKLVEENEAETKRLQLRLDVAEDELTVLGEFKSVKADLQQKLGAANTKIEQERQKHEEQLCALERKFIEEKNRLQKVQDIKVNQIKQRSREEAQRGLRADTRKLIADNKRMGEELRFQLQTSDELQRERNQLKRDNAELKREKSLNVDAEHEYAKQGFQREKLLQTANDTIKKLERSLSQVVHDFEREHEATVTAHHNEQLELSTQRDGLAHLVRLKNKELRTIKSLAREILQERTEVEEFFIEALTQVKQEKLAEKQERYRLDLNMYRTQVRTAQEDATGSAMFPKIRARTVPPGATKAPVRWAPAAGGLPGVMEEESTKLPMDPGTKVDLCDLSWTDRERVLRLLFARINAIQTRVAVVPEHSFAERSHSSSGGRDGGSMMEASRSSLVPTRKGNNNARPTSARSDTSNDNNDNNSNSSQSGSRRSLFANHVERVSSNPDLPTTASRAEQEA